MKKTLTVIMLALSTFIFSACGQQEIKEEHIIETTDEKVVYDVRNPEGYTVDEKGIVYTLTHKWEQQKNDRISNTGIVFSTYDLDGKLTEQYMLDSSLKIIEDLGIVRVIAVEEDTLYIVMDNVGVQELYVYNLTTKTDEKLYTFEDYSLIHSLIPIDGKVYFIGIDNNLLRKEYNGTDKAEHYCYEGEVFGCVNIKKKTMEACPIDFPISISAMPGSRNIMVYAYDDNEGYYFAEYDTDKEELKVLQYVDYGNNMFFNVIDEENNFIYIDLEQGLVCASPDLSKGTATVENKIVSGSRNNTVRYMGGQAFYLNDEQMLSRISLEGRIKWNPPIKALYSDNITTEPFGCGYSVITEKLESDEFALKVLAQDKDFDVYLLDSGRDVAANIKKNGIFYSLNEVEGVMEYLDACFPYVKEAALTEDGRVWMIPFYLDVDALVYDKNVFEEYGITPDALTTLDGFTEITDRLAKETDLRMDARYASLKYEVMDQYLSRYNTTDTELFREAAGILFNRFNKKEYGYRDSNLIRDWDRGLVDRFLYLETGSDEERLDYVMRVFGESEEHGAILYPVIEEGINNQATCVMISVNPKSENLENTLAYISEYAKYMLEKRNSFILKDFSTYDDTSFCRELYNCFADAEITLRIDSDIFRNDLENYLVGEITLEECIKESDRKLKVYLNE